MTDKEKVIFQLSETYKVLEIVTPHFNQIMDYEGMIQGCKDAIALLKEQEELINELLDLGYPHNFQHEAPWVVDYLYALTEIIKKAFKVKEGR